MSGASMLTRAEVLDCPHLLSLVSLIACADLLTRANLLLGVKALHGGLPHNLQGLQPGMDSDQIAREIVQETIGRQQQQQRRRLLHHRGLAWAQCSALLLPEQAAGPQPVHCWGRKRCGCFELHHRVAVGQVLGCASCPRCTSTSGKKRCRLRCMARRLVSRFGFWNQLHLLLR